MTSPPQPRLLDVEDLLRIADRLGLPVRDTGLLAGAAARPAASAFGQDAYPTLEQKAAAVMESIVRSHPLVDGNTRLGWLALVITLDMNGVRLEAPDDEAVDLTIRVAAGLAGLAEVVAAIEDWTRTG